MTTTHYLSYWSEQSCQSLDRSSYLCHGASSQYGAIQAGDTVWIMTFRAHTPGRAAVPTLIGRIEVGMVAGRRTIARQMNLRENDLWDAPHHIMARAGTEGQIVDIDLSALQLPLALQQQDGPSRFRLLPLPVEAVRVFTCLYENAQTFGAGGSDGGGSGFPALSLPPPPMTYSYENERLAARRETRRRVRQP